MNVLFTKDKKWIFPHLDHTVKSYHLTTELPVAILDANYDVLASLPDHDHMASIDQGFLQKIQSSMNTQSLHKARSTYSFVYKDYYTFLTAPIFDQKHYRGFMIVGPIFLSQEEADKAKIKEQNNKQGKDNMDLLFTRSRVKEAPRVFYLSQMMQHILNASMLIGDHSPEIINTIVSKPQHFELNSKEPFLNLIALKDLVIKGQHQAALKLYKKSLFFKDFESQSPLQAHNQLKVDLISLLSMIYQALLNACHHSLYLDHYKQDFSNRIMNSATINNLYAQGECMIIKFGKLVGKNKMNQSLPVKTAITYIHDHYQDSIRIEDLCQITFISKAHLSSLFKKETGLTIVEYIKNHRIKQSQYLLKNTNHSILEISLECGFEHANYFSSIFKKAVGMTPSAYRKQGEMP